LAEEIKAVGLTNSNPPGTSSHSHLRNGGTGDLRRCEWDRRSADCRLCNVLEVLCGVLLKGEMLKTCESYNYRFLEENEKKE